MELFLKDNKFYPISDTVYLKEISVKNWAEDAHIRIDFENDTLARCDIHGTLRLSEDAKDLWKKSDAAKVGRAVWVYKDKTYRSTSGLSFLSKNSKSSISQLKGACRDLCKTLNDWESEIERAGCEVLENGNATKIDTIGIK